MKPWIKFALTFVTGLLLGSAATGFYIHHCFTRAWVNSGNHSHVVNRLSSELGLNADQKAQVEKIFEDETPRLDLIRKGTNDQLKTLRDKTSARIRLILTAEQQKKFDDMRTKWAAREKKDDKGWHIP